MIRKLSILLNALYGEFLKVWYCLGFVHVPYGITKNTRPVGERVVISLTSYGRRVQTVLPYTIISLMRQSFKPDVIVLWLDKEHWSDNNLPKSLVKLKEKGLTIDYCDDIKSYKKLIPSLAKYPDDIIITVDDDLIYNSYLIERLVDAWNKNPNCIYAHKAFGITFGTDEKVRPYNDWDKLIYNSSAQNVFPIGCGGCLYKRKLLYPDVDRTDLFMKLAPKADDVWFFFMAILSGTPHVVLPKSKEQDILIDFFYQYTHKMGALYNMNDKENGNDPQIYAVMDYYHIKLSC